MEQFTFIVEKAEKTLKSCKWKEEFTLKETKTKWNIACLANDSHIQFVLKMVRNAKNIWPVPIRAECVVELAFGQDRPDLSKRIIATFFTEDAPKGFATSGMPSWDQLKTCFVKDALEIQIKMTCSSVTYEPFSRAYHCGHLSQDLDYLYNIKGDTQFILKAPATPLSVHRNILMARSEYFRKMFSSSNFLEAKTGTVDCSAEDPATVLMVLRYLYNGNISELEKVGDKVDECIKIYKLADMYMIRPLMELMVYYISLKVPTANREELAKILQTVRGMDPLMSAYLRATMSSRYEDIWAITVA